MLVWYGGSGTDMAELKSVGQGPWGTERSKQSERRLQDPETQSERCRGGEVEGLGAGRHYFASTV